MKNILVIDDEEDIAENLARILSEAPGRKVSKSITATDAYQKTIKEKFDLIITDYSMPNTHGIDLIKVIRGQELNQKTPILIISGYAGEFVDEIDSLSGVKILAKPFIISDFTEMVEDILKR